MTGARRPAWLAALLALAVLAGACSGSSNKQFDVELSRAHNLFTGSPVKVLGVEVGRVEGLESPEGSEAVVATVRVSGDGDVPADATARLVQGTVLGERFIQLDPAYTGGPRLEDGDVIPLERTAVPAEFDELLASLETFLEGLLPEEVDRFLVNVAETLAGQGEQLGRTLESTQGAIEVLHDQDDELVELLVGVADLTESLGTRDAELRRLLDDYASLTGTLAAERDAIDLALAHTARLLTEVEDLLDEHGERLGASTEVLARVGRTIDRNHTELRRAVTGQAELFRHAERVFDRERNWLPLINHSEDLPRLISERLANRLAGLCGEADLPQCDAPDFWIEVLPADVCLDPLFPCEIPEGEEPGVPFDEAVEGAIEEVPELEGQLGAPGEPADAEPAVPYSDEDGSADEEPERRSALRELLGGSLGGDR